MFAYRLTFTLVFVLSLSLSACDEPRASTAEPPTAGVSLSDMSAVEPDMGDVELDVSVAEPDMAPLESDLDPPEPPQDLIALYDPLPLVNPFTATGGRGAEVASVSPGASAPLGLTLTGPDTRSAVTLPPYHCAGYHYDDLYIQGFSHTHPHGMGVVDYGGLPFMPRAAWRLEHITSEGRMAPFSHEEERASPGYYAVTLQDDRTEVELVASPHGALHRYRFAEASAGAEGPVLIIELGDNLPNTETAEASARWTGEELQLTQRLKGGYSERFGGVRHHASVVLSVAPESISFWRRDAEGELISPLGEVAPEEPLSPLLADERVEGTHVGLVVRLPEGTTELLASVGVSFVDLEGARLNREAELPLSPQENAQEGGGDPFERALEAVQASWRELLSRVRVRGDEEHVRRFTTAHYHTLLMPSLNSDVDGRYRGLDQQIHTSSHPYYSDLSLWDTFRTLHSFYLLAHPELQRDVVRSLERMSVDGGSLPKWPLAHGYTGGMVGSPATIVLAEAHLKGLMDLSASPTFAASLAQSNGEAAQARRGGVEGYLSQGYVSADSVSGSVSRTLEFAWADHSLARWAASLGEQALSEALMERASGWRLLWDEAQGFLVGRESDGSFQTLRSDKRWESVYVEGNAWHYLWAVPFDISSLIEVQHGGNVEDFLSRLYTYWSEVYTEPDDLLPDDYYWHGNEPVLHYAWLSSLVGDDALTVEASHHVLATRYDNTPTTGLDGNDDSGTLSAWYLWATMGLYPIAGTTTYALGAPIFERVELWGEGSSATSPTLTINAPGAELTRTPTHRWLGERLIEGAMLEHGALTEGVTEEEGLVMSVGYGVQE